jgi:hypothetical protein
MQEGKQGHWLWTKESSEGGSKVMSRLKSQLAESKDRGKRKKIKLGFSKF